MITPEEFQCYTQEELQENMISSHEEFIKGAKEDIRKYEAYIASCRKSIEESENEIRVARGVLEFINKKEKNRG